MAEAKPMPEAVEGEGEDKFPPKPVPKFLSINEDNTSNVVSYRTEEETPIFSKRKMLLRIPQQYTVGPLQHLTVSKNWLYCVMEGPPTTLLRFFLLRAIPPAEINLEKYLAGYKITKLCIDHTGHHLLIPLVPLSLGLSADFLYVHGDGSKLRRIEKFKDNEITAVAFNSYMGTESTTGPILLGTSKGLIFETELTQDSDKPLYKKQVYDLGLGRTKYPITGLELLRMRDDSKVYVIIASAIDCIYTFRESFQSEDKLSLQAIFTPYVNGIRTPLTLNEPSDLNYSVFRCFAQPNDKNSTHWAWLCGVGIRSGAITYDDSEESILRGNDLISLDFEQKKHLSYEERRKFLPKTFILTEFHALLLYSDHITGICLLNGELVYEEYFHEQVGRLLNIVRDAFTGAIYVYTEKNVFNFKVHNENRNIWEIHLQKGNFDMAAIYAAADPLQLDIVLTHKADKAFDDGRHEEAALIYADTQMPFEEICLKFIDIENKRPMINYVRKLLDQLPEDAEEGVTALVLWLYDIYLLEINMPGRGKGTPESAMWQRELDEFMELPRVKKAISDNYTMAFDLVSEIADAENLKKLALAHQDYDAVIDQHFDMLEYTEALAVLGSQNDPELFYKYCPLLIIEVPAETVEVLKAQGRKLRIERLIPALIAIDTPKHIEEIIKYLEYAIYNLGETNQAVHNYLLRLYAEHQPAKLMPYLENEGQDITLVHYEINYALGVVIDFEQNVARVFLQCLLEIWPAAVELALTFDVALAKEIASKPKDEELRRKLWLRIAHHDIKGTNDVQKALNMLNECELLRIEDLLPLFSDFEKIDDFKQPICQALKEYNDKIQELQNDMEESARQADRVVLDLQTIRERSIRIEAHEVCSMCDSFLLVKPFFIFACGHKFHSDCLEKQVVQILSSDTSRRLTMLKERMETKLPQQQRKEIKAEIEQILASHCFFCQHMVEMIDQPFCEDWDQVNVDWE